MRLRRPVRETTRDIIAQAIADPLDRLRYLRSTREQARRPRRTVALATAAVALALAGWSPAGTSGLAAAKRTVPPQPQTTVRTERVWLVETRSGQELYSNGLRIEVAGAVPSRPRLFRLFAADGTSTELTQPIGILFHSTESHLAPFRPDENAQLLTAGEALMDYLRRHHSYHYLIDRFGRVFRVVKERDAADHAGNSVWSLNGRTCVNLNHAFLGVAFEGRTGESLSTAQLHSGRVLTDMLRARHQIDPSNCVTHAQVSVNPYNMRIGWHTDWARGLPFAQLGLPGNYEQPLASITHAGFEYDSAYLAAAGQDLWIGLYRSDEQVRAAADKHGLSTAAYRKSLRRRYLDFTRNSS